ncbi:unnamed protein product [Phytophthora fragariaefolia]|uniref:Unnamed protein product n=1 Tax=Phytophthora fragariaefolia TaxID=1490495 RepID=A0A9W6X4X6_9STRA|nr:unnamed protein product [Phytophthora fragariaefolia]
MIDVIEGMLLYEEVEDADDDKEVVEEKVAEEEEDAGEDEDEDEDGEKEEDAEKKSDGSEERDGAEVDDDDEGDESDGYEHDEDNEDDDYEESGDDGPFADDFDEPFDEKGTSLRPVEHLVEVFNDDIQILDSYSTVADVIIDNAIYKCFSRNEGPAKMFGTSRFRHIEQIKTRGKQHFSDVKELVDKLTWDAYPSILLPIWGRGIGVCLLLKIPRIQQDVSTILTLALGYTTPSTYLPQQRNF